MWEEVKGCTSVSGSSREIVTCCKRPSTATEPQNQSQVLLSRLWLKTHQPWLSGFKNPRNEVSDPPNVAGFSCILRIIWIWERQWSEFKQVVAVEYAGGGLLLVDGVAQS